MAYDPSDNFPPFLSFTIKFDEAEAYRKTIGCYLRKNQWAWLNGEYKTLLDEDLISAIETTEFYYTKGGTSIFVKVGTLERSIFLLSATECVYLRLCGFYRPVN